MSVTSAESIDIPHELDTFWCKLHEVAFSLHSQWKFFNPSKKGQITFDKFRIGCARAKIVATGETIKAIYEQFDNSNTGYFTYFDFCRVSNPFYDFNNPTMLTNSATPSSTNNLSIVNLAPWRK